MRSEPEAKNPKEQLNNAPKRRSAQFQENKKRRFENTQTCRTCRIPKRKKNNGNVRTFQYTDKPVTEDSKIDRGDEDLGAVAPIVPSPLN